MFGWFKSKEQKQKEFQEAVDIAIEEKERQKKILAELEDKRIQELKNAAIEAHEEQFKDIKNSDKPWMNLESTEIDSNGNIKIKLDWNTAFINYLRKECNFEGDEEVVVQRWLAGLTSQIYNDANNTTLNLFKEIEDSK